MSNNIFKTQIYTIWGNEDAKYAADEVLFNSDQVMIVKIHIFVTDSLFNDIESFSRQAPDIMRYSLEYIHKSNGVYFYIGKIERLKILKIVYGLAEFEIVVLKPYQFTIEACLSKTNIIYPCGTKNDICFMRKWPRLGDEKINKVIKFTI